MYGGHRIDECKEGHDRCLMCLNVRRDMIYCMSHVYFEYMFTYIYVYGCAAFSLVPSEGSADPLYQSDVCVYTYMHV